MKRRMAGQGRNRKNSDNSISSGKSGGGSCASNVNDVMNSDAAEPKANHSKSSSRTSLSDNSFECKSIGGVGAGTMSPSQQKGYHVELESGVVGLEAGEMEKLSPESADTTSSSDSGIGNTISNTNNMNNNTNINSSTSSTISTFTNSSGAAGSIRASLTSIGEFVARKHQQLSAANKQYSVESDDSSFLVYSIKVLYFMSRRLSVVDLLHTKIF